MQRREKQRKLSLHEEIEREAQQIEQELENHPELKSLVVTEEMDTALFEKIYDLENKGKRSRKTKEEERNSFTEFSEELAPDIFSIRSKAEEAGRTAKPMGDMAKPGGTICTFNTGKEKRRTPRRKKRKVFAACVAAVLLIVMTVGTTSIGSKSYWKVLWERVHGGEAMKVMNVEDMDDKGSLDGKEAATYVEIDEKLGIETIRIVYKPNGMNLIECQIDEELQVARLRYEYNNNIFRYTIYINNSDSSWGEKKEDIEVDSYTIFVNDMKIEAKEFLKEDSLQYRQEVDFEYKGAHYQLKGVMERTEFKKIVENLYFL